MKEFKNKSRHAKKRAAAMALSALLMTSIFSAAVEDDPATVALSYDGVNYTYATYAGTVGEFLDVEGIQVKDNDYTNFKRETSVADGMQLNVSVAKYVTVHDETGIYSAITYQTTVAGVLEEFEIPLVGNDSSYPAAGERIYDGIDINVARSKLVSFTRAGSTLSYYSYSKTVDEFLKEMGVECGAGEEVVPAGKTALSNGMSVKIVDKTKIASGKAMSPLNFNADLSKAKVIVCDASAYTAAADECWPYADGLTATGVKCQVGVVAVDPRVIPLKSKLYIEAVDGSFVYGYCTAEDTGGAIKGNKIDLAMNTKSDCFQFGRKKVRVYILP